MKILSAPDIRNVAVVGHNTVGKTTLVAAMLYAAGATTRPGPHRGRDLSHRFRCRRDRPKDLDQPGLRPCHASGRPDQLPRRPRLRDLRYGGARRGLGGRRGPAGDRCRLRRRSPDGEDVEVRAGIPTARPLRDQPDGPGARFLRPERGVAGEEVRARSRAPADPAGRREGFPRHRRSGSDGSAPSGEREARRRPDPARAGRAGQGRAREAGRERGRGGRRPDGEVLRPGHPGGGGHPSRVEEGDRLPDDLSRPVRILRAGSRSDPCARRLRRRCCPLPRGAR